MNVCMYTYTYIQIALRGSLFFFHVVVYVSVCVCIYSLGRNLFACVAYSLLGPTLNTSVFKKPTSTYFRHQEIYWPPPAQRA